MTKSEIFSIIIGTILGVFFLIPLGILAALFLFTIISPFLILAIPIIIIDFLVLLFCKIFRLSNPSREEIKK